DRNPAGGSLDPRAERGRQEKPDRWRCHIAHPRLDSSRIDSWKENLPGLVKAGDKLPASPPRARVRSMSTDRPRSYAGQGRDERRARLPGSPLQMALQTK